MHSCRLVLRRTPQKVGHRVDDAVRQVHVGLGQLSATHAQFDHRDQPPLREIGDRVIPRAGRHRHRILQRPEIAGAVVSSWSGAKMFGTGIMHMS